MNVTTRLIGLLAGLARGQLALEATFDQRREFGITGEAQSAQLTGGELGDPRGERRREQFTETEAHFEADHTVLHNERLRARREHPQHETERDDGAPDVVRGRRVEQVPELIEEVHGDDRKGDVMPHGVNGSVRFEALRAWFGHGGVPEGRGRKVVS